MRLTNKAAVLIACITVFQTRSHGWASGLEDSSNEVTAVSSKIFNGYKRSRLPDGSFQPETYGFAIGGLYNRRTVGLENASPTSTSDSTIDALSFSTIAKAIEGPLETQKYIPTSDPKTADLLIVVFWGRTIGTKAFAQSGMNQTIVRGDQDRIAIENAHLLGFDSEDAFQSGIQDSTRAMSDIRRELNSGVLDAIGEDRYFVVLQAFDLQHELKQNKMQLVWESRFSITQRGHDFGQDLPRMTQVAAKYFGQDSNGLLMKPIPQGSVKIGELKSLGVSPTK